MAPILRPSVDTARFSNGLDRMGLRLPLSSAMTATSPSISRLSDGMNRVPSSPAPTHMPDSCRRSPVSSACKTRPILWLPQITLIPVRERSLRMCVASVFIAFRHAYY